jgi:hypothetical protein
MREHTKLCFNLKDPEESKCCVTGQLTLLCLSDASDSICAAKCLLLACCIHLILTVTFCFCLVTVLEGDAYLLTIIHLLLAAHFIYLITVCLVTTDLNVIYSVLLDHSLCFK